MPELLVQVAFRCRTRHLRSILVRRMRNKRELVRHGRRVSLQVRQTKWNRYNAITFIYNAFCCCLFFLTKNANVLERCKLPLVNPAKQCEHEADHTNVTRYYYDMRTSSCKAFVYSGCDGNANNFESLNDCESRCQLPLLFGNTFINI